jgi:hypothetical protein
MKTINQSINQSNTTGTNRDLFSINLIDHMRILRRERSRAAKSRTPKDTDLRVRVSAACWIAFYYWFGFIPVLVRTVVSSANVSRTDWDMVTESARINKYG